MQDDLVALFGRQMSVQAVSQAASCQEATPPTPNPSPSHNPATSPSVYSITQHYHHSSHQAFLGTASNQSPTFLKLENGPDNSAEEVLMRHNVDPAFLSPSQLTLFRQAGSDQKARLIELWQISPSGIGNPMSLQTFGNNNVSDVEGAEQRAHQGFGLSDTPVLRAHGQASNAMPENVDVDSMDQDDMRGDDNKYAEPYIVSGYESLAQREYELSASQAHLQSSVETQIAVLSVDPPTGADYCPASDPVYRGREWWRHGAMEQPMEHQYGAFEQRNQYLGCGITRPHWFDDHEML
jgi:hypothetical protein